MNGCGRRLNKRRHGTIRKGTRDGSETLASDDLRAWNQTAIGRQSSASMDECGSSHELDSHGLEAQSSIATKREDSPAKKSARRRRWGADDEKRRRKGSQFGTGTSETQRTELQGATSGRDGEPQQRWRAQATGCERKKPAPLGGRPMTWLQSELGTSPLADAGTNGSAPGAPATVCPTKNFASGLTPFFALPSPWKNTNAVRGRRKTVLAPLPTWDTEQWTNWRTITG